MPVIVSRSLAWGGGRAVWSGGSPSSSSTSCTQQERRRMSLVSGVRKKMGWEKARSDHDCGVGCRDPHHRVASLIRTTPSPVGGGVRQGGRHPSPSFLSVLPSRAHSLRLREHPSSSHSLHPGTISSLSQHYLLVLFATLRSTDADNDLAGLHLA